MSVIVNPINKKDIKSTNIVHLEHEQYLVDRLIKLTNNNKYFEKWKIK
jgi:hypothetical protein